MTTPRYLHYYRCSLCRTVATAPIAARYNCLLCARWMRFLHAVKIETDEQRALAARGLVFNPYQSERQPWRCVRCGDEFRVPPKYRTDGRCCAACVAAEPVPPLRTPEEIAESEAAKDARVLEYEDAQERAYQRLEGTEKR